MLFSIAGKPSPADACSVTVKPGDLVKDAMDQCPLLAMWMLLEDKESLTANLLGVHSQASSDAGL